MSNFTADIAVIGGGPAGYNAAMRAAKMGIRVVLIEKVALGGICLNNGCIPTKTLLHSVNLLRSMQESTRFGIIGNSNLDIEKLRQQRDKVISTVQFSMAHSLEEHKIDCVIGQATFRSPHEIEIHTAANEVKVLHAEKTIIACGAKPQKLNVPGSNSANILYSNDLLQLKSIPSTLIIIGGGAVGLELASIMNRAGSQVCIVEIAAHVLPYEDSEITNILQSALKRDGIQIYTNATIQNIDADATNKKVYISQADTQTTLEAEAVCICIGQQPEISHLGLTAAGVVYNTQGIQVDQYMRTNVAHIYAAGDATGVNMLAYVASAQGRVAAANAAGRSEIIDYTAIPRCVFTMPEVASVGLNESEAAAMSTATRILRSAMAANSYATILGERRGMVKLVIEATSGKLLGAQLVGSGAVSLISECALAIKLGATASDLAHTLHPHPSLAEAIQEAALSDIG